MERFRVGIAGGFRRPDGSPTYPSFDLSPLRADPRIETVFIEPVDGVMTAASLRDVDAIILLSERFTPASMPEGGRLAVVARFGVGYDTVDVPTLDSHGVPLVITPDGVRRPVAVSIITYILALSQKLMIKDRLCREGPPGWARRASFMGEGLVGKTFGQLGIGNIGAEAFRMARPFDMRFIAHDPFVDPAVAADLGVELVSVEELFRRADFLSVSIPLSEATRHFVNADRLAQMKPTAYLINTARGPVVDQAALYRALSTGKLAGAGLDVFEVEPCPADEPLLALDTVIVTPHALCWTDECFAGIGAADIRAVIDIMHGRTPAGVVNRAVLDDPRHRARQQRLAAQHGAA